MRPRGVRPNVGGMDDRRLYRLGATAAIAGAAAQLVATVLEPDSSGDLAKAIRVVAGNGFWNGDRLLDLIGVFLAVGALTVVGCTFAEGPEREWARIGQPFLVLMAALGAGAVLAGANMKELANAWAGAAPHAQQSYLAAFDASRNAKDDLFFGAFLALGLYLAALAAAILSGRLYARWVGRAAALSAGLVLAGDLLVLVADAAFLAVLVGYGLFMVVLIALGASMWRRVRDPNLTPRPTGGRVMNVKLGTKLLLLLAVTAATAILVSTASASGPAAPGKELVQLTCDGLGTITVAVQRGENANGAGQIVDAQGHGIAVSATLTLTDLTTSTVLGTETTATGQGNGHSNQSTTRCSGVLFEGAASDFFGSELPPGLTATDTVQLTIDGFAIVKP